MTAESIHHFQKSDIAITETFISESKRRYHIFVIGKRKNLKKLKNFIDKSNLSIQEILKRINKGV